MYLKSTGQGASRSDYINANFVDVIPKTNTNACIMMC